MEFVSVQFKYQYTTRDGNLVSIKPNERYILVSKTNEHWWHVRKDQNTKPFYIPAQYVKQIQSGDESVCNNKTVNTSDVTRRKSTTMNLLAAQDVSKDSHRFSTFGVCDKVLDLKPRETQNHRPDQTTGSSGSSLNKTQTHNSAGSFSLTSAPQKTNKPQPSAKPHPVSKVSNGQHQRRSFLQEDKTQQTLMEDEDMTFPPPPTSPLYNMIPEIHIQDFDSFSDLPPPPAPNQHSLSQTAEKTSSTEALHIERVEDESLRSAVYVNVAQLRQGTSESPPSAPSSYSPSYLDPEGWEVHTDQESGQEYYYHPATGRTTWDCPFLDSPTDPERFHREELCSPSPPQSPSLLSPSTASPSACTSDWEQLVDESSGRTYFYNPMSGETSWEPPEQLSPYPPLMEPMSVHRFHEDGPPPLPEEDYPPEDYPGADQPESYEEQSAAGPPTFPREYSLGHVSRTVIPRASLDRSTPAGWNLTVEPNGTWVFTSEHSPDEWIKSVDDRGQTYYYLRDGSKSQWTLPEAPAGPGQSRVENGVEAENLSVIKNWRHTVGPSQFSAAQDEARFVPTHRRNTSDYSSDSSSTGNSPEVHHNAFGFRPWRNPYYLTSRWLRYNVQNLEKAGILNKTKVSENGKKVRKNWAQAWTVLHGGVLTFHKDPKSAASGASNKTNQIVAEVTVDLHGASIGWASKDKSSKKNVLELKGKNGVEFLIQYDTESIINDWLKVITDTIRQLEYQDHHSEEEDTDLYEKIAHTERDDKFDKRKSTKPNLTSSSSSAGDADQKRVRTKLMKFLMKRPTLQSVKDKGYIRDNVFGCHLATLCAQERTTVPSFVEKCVRAVERRGLDIDGLYRVSGNLATIQRLRFKADHEELDLEDGQWEDVHVITGALKLFFRELPEPLFPFSFFNNFIATIRISEYKSKRSFMLELIRKLPGPNHDTMELLFGHLRRVIQYGDDNRMTVQNVAIVFGPTLLRPETESSNIAMHMVFQNQIVEFILNEYEFLFHSS